MNLPQMPELRQERLARIDRRAELVMQTLLLQYPKMETERVSLLSYVQANSMEQARHDNLHRVDIDTRAHTNESRQDVSNKDTRGFDLRQVCAGDGDILGSLSTPDLDLACESLGGD